MGGQQFTGRVLFGATARTAITDFFFFNPSFSNTRNSHICNVAERIHFTKVVLICISSSFVLSYYVFNLFLTGMLPPPPPQENLATSNIFNSVLCVVRILRYLSLSLEHKWFFVYLSIISSRKNQQEIHVELENYT